jgi:hypothetical protein
MLYKVLIDGKSCHSGILTWSLPKEGQPGEWHSVEGPLRKCSNGLHFTDTPAIWWKPGCTVYLAEAEEIVGTCDEDTDRKVVARRGRLLREVTKDELRALNIFLDGRGEVKDVKGIASGSAQVEASGSAQVKASGSAQVKASGSAQVEAWDSAQVKASGSAQVEAWDSAQVEAWDSAQVEAWDSAQVEAWDSAQVKASGSAQVEASGSAQVEAWDSAQVEAWDSAQVEAWDSAQVKASGSAQVEAWDSAQVEAKDQVTIVSWYGSPVVKIIDRAVWIERGDRYCNPTAPKIHVAEEPKK